MSSDEKAHIGALALTLHIPASNSLKEKRRVLKSLKDRIRHGFNVSISEVGELDKWQSAVLGVAAISNDRGGINGMFESILTLVEETGGVRLTGHQMEFL